MSDDRGHGGAEWNDMNAPRPPQPRAGRRRTDGPAADGGLDISAAEHLLDGDSGSGPTPAMLRRVLDAAVAPAQPDELHHAEAVFAAFAALPRRGAAVRFGRKIAGLLGVKLVAAVVAATAVGGLALAASTGVLPTPLHPRPAEPHASAPPNPHASAGATTTSRPSPDPSGSASPNIAALCAAYTATVASQRDKALATPGFAALVRAAGGPEKVPAYCATTERSPAPRVTPSRHPTGRPSAQPSHPAGGLGDTPSPARKAG